MNNEIEIGAEIYLVRYHFISINCQPQRCCKTLLYKVLFFYIITYMEILFLVIIMLYSDLFSN